MAVRVRVSVPEPVTVGEPNDAVSPGDAATDRFTVPLKPLRPVTVSVEVAGWPALKAKLFGDALTVKSTTFTVTRIEWWSDPDVAVMLTS